MGKRIVSVSLELILNSIFRDDRKRLFAWKGGGVSLPPFITCDGMPADARILAVSHRIECGQLDFLIESEEFPSSGDGFPLTRIHPTMTSWTSTEMYLESNPEKHTPEVLEAIRKGIAAERSAVEKVRDGSSRQSTWVPEGYTVVDGVFVKKTLGTLDDSTGSFLGYPVVIKEGEKPVPTGILLGDIEVKKVSSFEFSEGSYKGEPVDATVVKFREFI